MRLGIFAVLAAAAFCGQSIAAEPTTVALAIQTQPGGEQELAALSDALLALLEVHAAQDPKIAVVERMEIQLPLEEFILDRSRATDQQAQLQFGRLATADLIVMARITPPRQEDHSPRVFVRVVDARTGVIRGATLAAVDETTLDDVARQMARYVSAVAAAPQQAGVTVAVGAFESVGRFDRLRPLELGVRDMLTEGLLHLGAFQVLQRSSMEQLNVEMSLIRSGLADQDRLPATLPSRESAYFLHGTIDERHDNDRRLVILNAVLTHAKTGKAVQELVVEVPPDRIPQALSHWVDVVGGHLAKAARLEHKRRRGEEFDETEFLLHRAIDDLGRFRRLCPIDYGYRRLRVPGQPSTTPPGPVILDTGSPLGRHLLRKSVDRLESVAFIDPDRTAAALALGFCRSMHLKDVYQPERADELFRTVFARDPQGSLGATALEYLAELSFHHTSGEIDRAQQSAAAERIAFAFRNMPAEYRSRYWPRLCELLARLQLQGERAGHVVQTMNLAAALSCQESSPHRETLADGAALLAAVLLARGDAAQQAAGQALLTRWGAGETLELGLASLRRLGMMAAAQKQYQASASWFLAAAELAARDPQRRDGVARANLLMHAARNLRNAGEPRKALELLLSIERPGRANSLNRGYIEVEKGACYEALGQPQTALEIWAAAAEQIPALADNSDVVQRIERLGSVPLSENRELDVSYVLDSDQRPVACRLLATDGQRIFCAAGGRVRIYEPARRAWTAVDLQVEQITCLMHHQEALWLGTPQGLYRYDLTTRRVDSWTTETGLPDARVVSLAAGKEDVYAGLGNAASGGLVRINAGGAVWVFEQADSPTTAATHVVVHEQGVFARTSQAVHHLDFDTNKWTRRDGQPPPHLFAGAETVWASQMGKELYPYQQSGEVSERFRKAWFVGDDKLGYSVRFVIEHGDRIYFGGTPWQPFRSTGFYRVDQRGSEFVLYGPRDGFRIGSTFITYDGIWAAGRIWLATGAGLAEVAIR